MNMSNRMMMMLSGEWEIMVLCSTCKELMTREARGPDPQTAEGLGLTSGFESAVTC